MVIKDIILLRFVNRECDWGNVSLNRWSHRLYTAPPPLYNSLNSSPRAALYALVSSQSRRGFSFGTRRCTNETTKKRSPAPPTRYGDIRVQSTRAVDCSSTAHRRRLMSLTTQGRLNHTLTEISIRGPACCGQASIHQTIPRSRWFISLSTSSPRKHILLV